MKRGREGEVGTIISIADCITFLSHTIEYGSMNTDSQSRVFECKTCNRKFSSFQALGGHRASHKKQRSVETESTCSSPKPKRHECVVCGLEFTVGQALGGHMRRHKLAASDGNRVNELTLFPSLGKHKKENGGEFLSLDLNLTPRENGLEFHLKKVAPYYNGNFATHATRTFPMKTML